MDDVDRQKLGFSADEMTVIYMVINHLLETSPPIENTRAAELVNGIRDKLGGALVEKVTDTVAEATDTPLEQLLKDVAAHLPTEMIQNLEAASGDDAYSTMVDLDDTPDPTPEWLMEGDHDSLVVRESATMRKNAAWINQIVFGIMYAEHIGIPVPPGLYFPDGLFAASELLAHPPAHEGFFEEVRERKQECVVLYGRGTALHQGADGVPDAMLGSQTMFHYRGIDGLDFAFMSHPHGDKPECDNPACINAHASYHVMAGRMKLTEPECSFLESIFPEPS